MQNKIELQLEKVFKEYLNVKHFLKEFYKNLSKLKEELAKESLEKTEEEIYEYTFEKFGYISAIEGDLAQLKGRLYHTYEAYKDLVEIPKEIKEEVEDLKFTLTYNIRGTDAEIVDQEAYNFYKNNFIEGQKYLKAQMGGK